MCRKSGKNISINRSIDYCALSPFLSGRQTVRSLETESDVADFGLIRGKVRVMGITGNPFIFGLRILSRMRWHGRIRRWVALVSKDRLHFANRNDIVIDVPEGQCPTDPS